MLMNKRENELYDKKEWKHTNPIETLIKALKDINFGKNDVLLSIGANDYETERVVSESFKNNELIIATDVRGYNADMLVNSHLLVLKDKIDAELFTIDDFNKFIGNNNYTNRQRNPYVVYDRFSALWYSLYKGKTYITKKILDNYIGLLGENGYLITDFYEYSEITNYIHDYINLIIKKYQNSTYNLFKYYINNIDSYIDKKYENDNNKLNHLIVISKNNLVKLSSEITKVNTAGNPKVNSWLVNTQYTLTVCLAILYLTVFPIIFLFVMSIFKTLNLHLKLLMIFFIYLIFSHLLIFHVFGYVKKKIRSGE